MREKLGESLTTIQKFDKPLAEATTSSLEALKAYSEGVRARTTSSDAAAIPYLKRAIELDPNFATAYVFLGISYSNLGENGLSNDYIAKAYELRDRVSEQGEISNLCGLLPVLYRQSGEIEAGLRSVDAGLSA